MFGQFCAAQVSAGRCESDKAQHRQAEDPGSDA